MNTNAKLLLLSVIVSSALGCTREVESTSTKISIQLPNLAASDSLLNAKSETVNSSSLGTIISNDGSTGANKGWSAITPSGVTSFNCYLVVVNGPEAILNRNRCGKKSTAAGTVNGLTSDITFGPVAGIIAAGQSLDIEVASGSDRVVTLVGFQVAEAANISQACVDYNSATFDKSKLSKPYVLGKSAKMELKPTVGNDFTSVPITMAFSETAFFEDCEGPEFSNNDSRTPTQVSLKKNFFPSNATAVETCTPLDVEIHDANGRAATANTDTVLKIKDATGSTIPTYSGYTNCHNQSGITTSFSLLAGTSLTQRWYLSNATAGTSAFYQLDVSSTNLVAEQAGTALYIPNYAATKNKIDLTGPTVVATDVCYKYDVGFRTMTGAYFTPPTSTHVYVVPPETATLYTDANCATPASLISNASQGITRAFDFTMTSLTNSTTKTFYAKFSSALVYKNVMSAYDSAFDGVTLPASLNYFIAQTTELVPVATIIREDKLIPSISSTCFGPFRLALINANGVEVPVPLGSSNYTFAVTGSATGVKLASYCAAGTLTGLYIAPGSSSATFYIVTTTPNATAPQYSFKEPARGTAFDTVFKFTLN